MFRRCSIYTTDLLIASIVVLASDTASAQAAKDFDKNGDGLDLEEFTAYYQHVRMTDTISFANADADKDGMLTADEKAKALAKLEEAARLTREDAEGEFAQAAHGARTATYADAERVVAGPQRQAPDFSRFAGFQLRAQPAGADVMAIPSPKASEKDWKDAKPALFSYQQDFEEGHDTTLVARGALSYPVRKEIGGTEPPTSLSMNAYAIVPSLSFDRELHDAKDDKNVSSLIGRIAGQFEYVNVPGSFLEGIYPSIGLAYATDFELEADVFAVELDALPVIDLPGQGVKRPLFSGSPIAFRWRVAGHAEGGYTADAGDDVALEEDEGFVRFGPKGTLELLPELDYLERLRVRLDYQYLMGFWGSPKGSHLLESTLSVRLDERGFASIDLNYRDGDIPLLATSTQMLALGLGLKF